MVLEVVRRWLKNLRKMNVARQNGLSRCHLHQNNQDLDSVTPNFALLMPTGKENKPREIEKTDQNRSR